MFKEFPADPESYRLQVDDWEPAAELSLADLAALPPA